MVENSNIEWTDHTFNPWIGCQKVGPGCDNCYAETLNERWHGGENWGPGAPRRLTSDANWKKALKWNREARTIFGRPARVFCASLADVFDNAVDPAWRARLFRVIYHTPNLQWLLLTKRPGNIANMLPRDWGDGYPNVVMMATVVNQEEADRDLDKLRAVPARWRGLSIEPMLGPMYPDLEGIDWVICGGESGAHARPIHPDWARVLRDQCASADIAFLFKQWGGLRPKTNGRLLDGRTWDGFPGQPEGGQ